MQVRTTKLNNGLIVLAHNKTGFAKQFVNLKQVHQAVDVGFIVITLGAASEVSSSAALSSQAGSLSGFLLFPAGSTDPSLHRLGFLGRCPHLS